MSNNQNNSNMLNHALSFLNAGYSIIPVGLDKRPLIQWKEFQTRKPTVVEVAGWLEEFKDCSFGIVTGRISDLTVIDIESDGDFGIITDETFVVQTGGGGKHFYFKFDERFKNAVRVLPSVDIRSEGGYVVSPFSKTSKGLYLPLGASKISDVAKMSQKTVSLLIEANRGQIRGSVFDVAALNASKTAFPLNLTPGLVYEGAGEGSRNDSMTKFAGQICAKMHPSIWDTLGWQLFQESNSKNVPPLSDYELRQIWQSIQTREMRQNPYGRSFGASSKLVEWGPSSETKKDEPVLEKTEEELEEENSNDTLHVSRVAELQTINSDICFPIDMPPIDEALLGGFSPGELVVVAGQSGVGKTSVIQDWTMTLASGGKTKRENLPVLWFSYEVLARPLWKKFQEMGATTETPIYMPKLNESGQTEWVVDVIERSITKWGIRVVAIDHLGFLRPPKGNYANMEDAITHTVRELKKLAVKHGLIIFLPVHVRKTISKVPDLNDIKSASGIAQEADGVFFIAREKDRNGLQTTEAQVWLVKNRKSGIATNVFLDFQFGRYYYDKEKDQYARDKQNGERSLKELNTNSKESVKEDYEKIKF